MSGFTINDLRDTLAETIRELRDPRSGMTVEKARAINELSQTVINSAKVEVDALKVFGAGKVRATGFLALDHQDTTPGGSGGEPPGTGSEAPGTRAIGQSPRGSLR